MRQNWGHFAESSHYGQICGSSVAMEYSLTNTGVDTVADAFVTRAASVAVGSGTRAVAGEDDDLAAEEYRASVDAASVIVETVNKAGTVRVAIILTGGSAVPANKDLYELGVFDSDGQLLYRQVSDEPRSVGEGQTMKIETDIRISQATV